MEKYNIALSWEKNKCFFTDTLISISKKKNLSFLWVDENNVEDVIKKLQKNQLRIDVMVDTEATYDIPGDLYSRLNFAVKDSGGVVITDPDRTRMYVDKTVMYYEILDSKIVTPYTVVVRNWEPRSFRVSEDEKRELGGPFIIKPGCGWGHRGVVYNAKGTMREIAKARDFDRGDNFLLQEKIIPVDLDGKRAWFRVFHVFDTIILCWWDDRVSHYEHVTVEEFHKHKLSPFVEIIAKIGKLTRMTWFSTEIAIDIKNGKRRIVTIDYVNDQCDMEAATESKDGVPNEIVNFTANSIINAAERVIKKRKGKSKKEYTILFHKNRKLKMEGLGSPPELLGQG
ncbi:MAG: hypothetical protein ABH844_03660 [Candidatus Omnitrophota bacterium]